MRAENELVRAHTLNGIVAATTAGAATTAVDLLWYSTGTDGTYNVHGMSFFLLYPFEGYEVGK